MSTATEQIRAALAAGPTPGPWYGDFRGVWCDAGCDFDRIARSEGTRGKTEYEKTNNEFIAACNPEAIAELLAERDALAQRLEAAEKDAKRVTQALCEAEALAMDAEAKALRYVFLRDSESADWRPFALRADVTRAKADAMVDAARGAQHG